MKTKQTTLIKHPLLFIPSFSLPSFPRVSCSLLLLTKPRPKTAGQSRHRHGLDLQHRVPRSWNQARAAVQ